MLLSRKINVVRLLGFRTLSWGVEVALVHSSSCLRLEIVFVLVNALSVASRGIDVDYILEGPY